MERIQKLLARAGLGSRRACEEIIQSGRVTVNGRIPRLGERADPAADEILVDGLPLKFPETHTTVALYKPKHALSTDSPHPGDRRPTARSLISLETRLFPIGRLDAESEGLMLFSDDGELANRLSHPRYQHDKGYRVLVRGRPTEETLRRWRRGVRLEEGKTAPARVTVVESSEKQDTWLRITLQEGRKRQIRRVADLLGHPVQRLIRERIGPIRLGQLKPGEWRPLTEAESRALQELRQKPPRSRKGSRDRRPE